MAPAFPSRPRVRDRGDPLEIPEDAVTAGPEPPVNIPESSAAAPGLFGDAPNWPVGRPGRPVWPSGCAGHGPGGSG